MNETVEWVLNLKDQFSGPLNAAKEHTERFEETVNRTKEAAGSMLESMGIGFAIFKGFEFVGEAREEVEKLDFSASQLRAGLESTRGVAGLTFGELTKGAADAAHNFKFTQSQIEQMQSVLLTFPAVTKKTFGDASQAIFDMSTRLHQDLDSTAIQVGKALQDPIKGITALHRVGVNFNEAQTEMIKKMVAGGHAAQAQAVILKELQTEFEGSARAAAEADPLFHFNKSMEDLKISIGEVVVKLEESLAPALEGIADTINGTVKVAKDLYHWFGENKKMIAEIGIVLGTTTTAWAAYTVWATRAAIGSAVRTTLFAVETAVITGLGTAVAFVNAMFMESPIGWIVIGVAAITAAVIYCYNHFETFRAIVWGVWGVIKEFVSMVGDAFKGLYHVIHGAMTFNWSEMKDGLMSQVNFYADAGKRLGAAWRQGFDGGIADFRNGSVASSMTLFKPEDTFRPKGKGQGDSGDGGISNMPGNKVSGQKILNIAINISGGIAPNMSFHTTNIQESASKIKEMVARALTSAINDSQIIGDH